MRPTSLLAVSLALFFGAGFAAAQAAPPPADSIKVDYFDYANTAGAPDGTLRLTNPGSTGTNMCAAIYVFNPLQEISECCACLITPNGLRTLSVNTDLTNNPLTSPIVTTGSISIVSTPTVNAGCPLPTTVTPTSAGVRAWVTHIDRSRIAGKTSGFVATAAPSSDATFSSYEQVLLQQNCYAISIYGSGRGICTCGTGD